MIRASAAAAAAILAALLAACSPENVPLNPTEQALSTDAAATKSDGDIVDMTPPTTGLSPPSDDALANPGDDAGITAVQPDAPEAGSADGVDAGRAGERDGAGDDAASGPVDAASVMRGGDAAEESSPRRPDDASAQADALREVDARVPDAEPKPQDAAPPVPDVFVVREEVDAEDKGGGGGGGTDTTEAPGDTHGSN